MKPRIGLLGLSMVIAVSLLLPGTTVFAAQRTSTVGLNSYDSSSGLASVAGAAGTLTVTIVSGPGGGSALSGTVEGTVSTHSYALYVVRGSRRTIVGVASMFAGGDGPVTLDGVQLAKAPTNGQRFELVDLDTGAIVALSDPVRY